MRINVDIERSLEAGRVKPKNLNAEHWLSILGYVVVTGALLASSLMVTYFVVGWLATGGITLVVVILFTIFFSASVLVLFGLYQENRLIRSIGKDLQTNRLVIVDILKNRYKTNLIAESDRIVTYYRRATFWKFSLRIIVLFDGNDVLINISRFNQIDIKSVFHEFFSSVQARSILQEFSERLE